MQIQIICISNKISFRSTTHFNKFLYKISNKESCKIKLTWQIHLSTLRGEREREGGVSGVSPGSVVIDSSINLLLSVSFPTTTVEVTGKCNIQDPLNPIKHSVRFSIKRLFCHRLANGLCKQGLAWRYQFWRDRFTHCESMRDRSIDLNQVILFTTHVDTIYWLSIKFLMM